MSEVVTVTPETSPDLESTFTEILGPVVSSPSEPVAVPLRDLIFSSTLAASSATLSSVYAATSLMSFPLANFSSSVTDREAFWSAE